MQIQSVPEPSTLLFLLLLLGWFTAVVVLLANPKTRKAGLIVLFAPLILPAILIPVAAGWWMGSFQSPYIAHPDRITQTLRYTDEDAGAPPSASSSRKKTIGP